MSTALIHSRAQSGVDAPPVQIEVHLSGGLPGMSIVGLPEAAVRESKDRVRAALLCAQYEMPARRITVNLAPADLPKEGSRFDLPIALGILLASGQLRADALDEHEFFGELALNGALRGVPGVLSAVVAAGRSGRAALVPTANATEAAWAGRGRVLAADSLLDVCAHLSGQRALDPIEATADDTPPCLPDLADVRGQPHARRALEIAAAGGHHILMVGPPGSGKSLLAQRLPGLLPALDDESATETATLRSLARQPFDLKQWRWPAFRSPHHTASAIALVGGGSPPRPGEISLAHHGVLFLDELPEWDRRVLEVLRQPLENGRITISRAARQAEFPARFQLVAAMNPCPCGWAGDPSGRCRCSHDQMLRYRGRISGPLLDRIDLMIDVPRLDAFTLRQGPNGEGSAPVKRRVLASRRTQAGRGAINALLGPAQVREHCALDTESESLLQRTIEHLQMSARSTDRVLRVARTIADLADAERITTAHLAEALSLRRCRGLG